MNNNQNPIQSPPPNGQLSLAQDGDGIVISGKSQGVPEELFSPEDLPTVAKTMEVMGKLTGTASNLDLNEKLAQMDFDWSLSISGNLVTLSSSSFPRNQSFTPNEIRRIVQSEKGNLMAELSTLRNGNAKYQVLAGNLSAEDQTWLSQSLIQVFGLDEHGVAQVSEGGGADGPPSEGFKLLKMGGGSRVEIKEVRSLFVRVLPLVIGGLVLPMMGFALLKGGEGSGLLVDLMAKVSDDPALLKVARYAVIAGLIYLGYRVLEISLGTLSIRLDQQTFEMKKGILGLGVARTVSRSEITGLKQTSWTKIEEDQSNNKLETVRYWKLELQGSKTISLLTNEIDPSNVDWLGQYMADWFGVPFSKEER